MYADYTRQAMESAHLHLDAEGRVYTGSDKITYKVNAKM